MSRFPRAARNARIKCLPCNAPATETVDGKYVCVSCGVQVIQTKAETNAETKAASDT